MYDKYVTEYAQGIAERKYNLSRGLFHAEYIMNQYKEEIWDQMEKAGIVKGPDDSYKLNDIEWDDYDCSIELIDCVEGFTMTQAQVDLLKKEMGFHIIFVNYKAGPHLYGRRTAAMNAMPVIQET